MNKIISLIGITALVAMINGCTFEVSRTQIQTPAVYNIQDGKTNLVSPATTKTISHRERTWLPEGYSWDFVESGYGFHFSAIDKASGNPGDIKGGVWYSSQRGTPSNTNRLYAPPITSSGKFANTMPFTLKGNAAFSAGESQVQQSDTNSSSGASVPGVPNNQQK